VGQGERLCRCRPAMISKGGRHADGLLWRRSTRRRLGGGGRALGWKKSFQGTDLRVAFLVEQTATDRRSTSGRTALPGQYNRRPTRWQTTIRVLLPSKREKGATRAAGLRSEQHSACGRFCRTRWKPRRSARSDEKCLVEGSTRAVQEKECWRANLAGPPAKVCDDPTHYSIGNLALVLDGFFSRTASWLR